MMAGGFITLKGEKQMNTKECVVDFFNDIIGMNFRIS